LGLRNPVAALRDYVDWYGSTRWPVFVAGRFVGWPTTVDVHHKGTGHPVAVRPRSSDVKMYHSVFTTPQYAVPLEQEPATIFDCGANVGYAAVWFANRYPAARIWAIEPEKTNYALVVRNTLAYPRIVPIHAAIWNADTALDVVDVGLGACGFQTRGRGGTGDQPVIGQTLAFTVRSLMDRVGVTAVDFLKIDIEGAEAQLLEEPLDWLRDVGVMVVEFHDGRIDGVRSRFDAVAERYFQFTAEDGENVFYARAPFVTAPRPGSLWRAIGGAA
jgi:FkbM family methyltransferase